MRWSGWRLMGTMDRGPFIFRKGGESHGYFVEWTSGPDLIEHCQAAVHTLLQLFGKSARTACQDGCEQVVSCGCPSRERGSFHPTLHTPAVKEGTAVDAQADADRSTQPVSIHPNSPLSLLSTTSQPPSPHFVLYPPPIVIVIAIAIAIVAITITRSSSKAPLTSIAPYINPSTPPLSIHNACTSSVC